MPLPNALAAFQTELRELTQRGYVILYTSNDPLEPYARLRSNTGEHVWIGVEDSEPKPNAQEYYDGAHLNAKAVLDQTFRVVTDIDGNEEISAPLVFLEAFMEWMSRIEELENDGWILGRRSSPIIVPHWEFLHRDSSSCIVAIERIG
ncbi:MAG: hypothetical protein ACHQNE_02845 [Candidatus Kapaibacterium sp.]